MYMRKRRRKPGEALIAAPRQFGLAQLHLHMAEAFFQMVRGREATSMKPWYIPTSTMA